MNNRWRSLLCVLLIAVVTGCTLLIPKSAYAWKTKTHGYSANLLLKDAKDGKLKIDGTDYAMPAEYKTALEKYPQSFRAGVLGPDFYPDMLTGQSYIHPYDPDAGVGVGDWLKLLVEGVNSMSPDSDERYNALAFTLGMAVHYAGDMFGHDFINAFAGGAYPAYADAAHDVDKLYYIIRHMAEEYKMDTLIGNRLGETEVDAPDEFILSTWIYNGSSPNAGPAKIYDKYGGMMYQYIYLVEFRDTLHAFLEEYRGSLFLTPFVEIVGHWVDDLDIATKQLIATFDDLAHEFLIKSEDTSDVGLVTERLDDWINKYGLKATPFPDIMVDFVNKLQELTDKFIAATGIDKVTKTLKEFIYDLMEDAIYGIFNAMGFDYKQYTELTKDPYYALIANGGSRDDYYEFMTYMNLFETDAEAFDAFYNTLLMGKLILMGPESLNSFFKKYGVFTIFNTPTTRVKMDSFDIIIHTKKNEKISHTYGTDDNVHLKVFNKDELLLDTILDKPGKNVFENNKTDVFNIALPKKIYPEDLRLELSTDRKWHDEWTLDQVFIRCYAAGAPLYLLQKGIIISMIGLTTEYPRYYIMVHFGDKTFAEETDKLSLALPMNIIPQSNLKYTTSLNLNIINFMFSNDNSTQWVNYQNTLWLNKSARKKVLYEVFHGFKPKITLKADKNSFVTGEEVNLTASFSSYWNGIRKERRDKEFIIPEVNETLQNACSGPVEILVQNEQGETVDTLNGSVGNGIAKVSLSGLAAGTYKLVAKYNGDDYNGTAVSDPLTVNVLTPGDGKIEVTYLVKNGTWADGTTGKKTEYVYPGEKPVIVPTGMISGTGGGGTWKPTNPHETVINEPTVFTYTFTANHVSSYTVTYKIVNGTWADGSTDNKTEFVTCLDTVHLWSPLNCPSGMKPFSGYGNGSWDNVPSTSLIESGTDVFTYTFHLLPKYDVTYKVVNGTWDDGSRTDITEKVTQDEFPSAVPSGMKASPGFRNGTWDKDPSMTPITEATTFTYTFEEIPKHTVTYRIVNGTWSNGETDDITETVEDGRYPASVPGGMQPLSDRFTDGSWDIDPADVPVLSPVVYTFSYKPIWTVTYKVVNGTWADGETGDRTEDVVDRKSPSGIPSGMIAGYGFRFGAWDTSPVNAIITGNNVYTWTFSAIPQYPVTYKIVNGTWADGTVKDVTESVFEGESPSNVPTGMIANEGYNFGDWDRDPAKSVITKAETFIWTFEEQAPVYSVTCEQDGWRKGSGIGLDFVVHRSVRDDLTFSRFRKLLLNGKELGAADADVSAGSLNVTVKASKLETLDPGNYTIKIIFTDGEAELALSVRPGKTPPKTGDTADLLLWAGMLLAGLSVIGAVITCGRRRKSCR